MVVLTSSAADAGIERAYGLHASCYVVKPVGAEEFEKTVRSIREYWLNVVKLPNGR